MKLAHRVGLGMKSIKLILTLMCFGGVMHSAFACTDMHISPNTAAAGAMMTVTCKTDVEVKQIAVEITGEFWNASFPTMYDNATHGDGLSDDKIYTLNISAPPVPGDYSVKFYRILPDQSELESEQLTFSVQ
jgi:hypothetical protein